MATLYEKTKAHWMIAHDFIWDHNLTDMDSKLGHRSSKSLLGIFNPTPGYRSIKKPGLIRVYPNLHRGGPADPPGGISCMTPQWTVRWSSNFMTLFLPTFFMSHWGHFSKKKFENLKNRKNFFRSFRHQRVPPLKKKFWNFFFPIFLQ